MQETGKVKKPKPDPIIVGKVYTSFHGCQFTVIEYKGCNDIIIKFQDEHTRSTKAQDIRSGFVKNPHRRSLFGVGYIGSGKYSTKGSPEEKAAYGCWSDMIRRCYYERELLRYPTYRGCSVCPEWHNFQVFAEWYFNQPFSMTGYHLDKDILVKDNKVYSPDTCSFVPYVINSLLCDSGKSRGKCVIGVSFHKRDKNYSANVSVGGRLKYLGGYATEEEASAAYVVSKEALMKTVAKEWRGKIEEKVYHALMEWTVY